MHSIYFLRSLFGSYAKATPSSSKSACYRALFRCCQLPLLPAEKADRAAPSTADSVLTNRTKTIYYISAVQPCRRMSGCCAVGSAPALGAGGREFESRHSDHKKSHDEALEIAFISWLYLLYIGLKMAGKCDRSATNSGKTCFVRQCAPLFCMPCLYHTAV